MEKSKICFCAFCTRDCACAWLLTPFSISGTEEEDERDEERWSGRLGSEESSDIGIGIDVDMDVDVDVDRWSTGPVSDPDPPGVEVEIDVVDIIVVVVVVVGTLELTVEKPLKPEPSVENTSGIDPSVDMDDIDAPLSRMSAFREGVIEFGCWFGFGY